MEKKFTSAKTKSLPSRVPRYTSYPPANHFKGNITNCQTQFWLQTVPKKSEISLYIHIPFCRSLCWFCACRTQGLAKRSNALGEYLEILKQEIDMLRKTLPMDVTVNSLHLGGGTPTILSEDQITDLLGYITNRFQFTKKFQFSVEIDPTEIDQPRVNALKKFKINRASVGVQDFNPTVQQSIGRTQTFEQTKHCFDMLRKAKVASINVDFLYGLPKQTKDGFIKTIRSILDLNPDRIAMYGYAHVPWIARRQIMINHQDLPKENDRKALMEVGRDLIMTYGYLPIGIDHFATPKDPLALAENAKLVCRNFQGYNDHHSDYIIGVGASAISHFTHGYAQNAVSTRDYMERISKNEFATTRGHAFTLNDQIHGHVVEQLMCYFEVSLQDLEHRFGKAAADICQKISADPSLRLIGNSTYRIP
ncbi:MAG: oxygen-independent coproporphyrinogen III oxidase, partial [Emcibacteraceae bacterium]|nr:oxygen-independent coproporphyrinogen III oxidase [Emcibacteraceae bacterium]